MVLAVWKLLTIVGDQMSRREREEPVGIPRMRVDGAAQSAHQVSAREMRWHNTRHLGLENEPPNARSYQVITSENQARNRGEVKRIEQSSM